MFNSKIVRQLEALTNEGMIDAMHHSRMRFIGVQHPFTPYIACWQKWIRR